MAKKLSAIGVSLLVVFAATTFWGCFDSPLDAKDDVDITISGISEIQAGQNRRVDGEIDATVELTSITYSILDDSDNAVAADKIRVQVYSMIGETDVDLANDAELTIVTTTTACNGTYTLKIDAVAGTATTSQSASFVVRGGVDCSQSGTPITTGTVTAGAQGSSSLGSSIDLDEPVAWLSAEAAGNVAEIDLVYAYSNTDAVEKLFSPAHAKVSGYTFASGWESPNGTKFYKVLAYGATEFNAVTTAEEILELWNEPSAEGTSIAAAQGDVFIAETNQDAIVLLLIHAQAAGSAGSITIKTAK